MSKYLITGAAGFIGSHLVEYLLSDGVRPKDLRLLLAPWDTLDNLQVKNLDIFIGDIRNRKDVEKSMAGIDIVYHLAAKIIKEGANFEYYRDTNILGTKNLLEAAKKQKIKKFIYFSSISVFGLPAYKGDMGNVNESWPKEPSEPYGMTKLKSEEEVIMANKEWRLPYIIIRPTTVYGPRDKAGIYQLLKAIKNGYFIFIGEAKNKMDYVYVKDLVRAARMAEKGKVKNEDFIIGAGRPITQVQIVTSIAKSMGKKIPNIHISKGTALVFSYIVEYILKLIKIKPPLFPERVRVLTTNCYFEINKAERILGYVPKYSFEKGIKETLSEI